MPSGISDSTNGPPENALAAGTNYVVTALDGRRTTIWKAFRIAVDPLTNVCHCLPLGAAWLGAWTWRIQTTMDSKRKSFF
jgi:hypothetical protein